MNELESRFSYLRTEERDKLVLKTMYDLQVSLLEQAIKVLKTKIEQLNAQSAASARNLADVRELLRLKGLDQKPIWERDLMIVTEKAEDNANFDFYCLGSNGARKRSEERNESARKYHEERAKRGYDSDFD